jgi:hypothetical protein
MNNELELISTSITTIGQMIAPSTPRISISGSKISTITQIIGGSITSLERFIPYTLMTTIPIIQNNLTHITNFSRAFS